MQVLLLEDVRASDRKTQIMGAYRRANGPQTLTYASNLVQHFKVAIPHTRARLFYLTLLRDMLDLAFSGSKGPEI